MCGFICNFCGICKCFCRCQNVHHNVHHNVHQNVHQNVRRNGCQNGCCNSSLSRALNSSDDLLTNELLLQQLIQSLKCKNKLLCPLECNDNRLLDFINRFFNNINCINNSVNCKNLCEMMHPCIELRFPWLQFYAVNNCISCVQGECNGDVDPNQIPISGREKVLNVIKKFITKHGCTAKFSVGRIVCNNQRAPLHETIDKPLNETIGANNLTRRVTFLLNFNHNPCDGTPPPHQTFNVFTGPCTLEYFLTACGIVVTEFSAASIY